MCLDYFVQSYPAADYRRLLKTERLAAALLHVWIFCAALREINVLLLMLAPCSSGHSTEAHLIHDEENPTAVFT